jgi:signal transduction histidine kinase/FixJ family two-component response regulator
MEIGHPHRELMKLKNSIELNQTICYTDSPHQTQEERKVTWTDKPIRVLLVDNDEVYAGLLRRLLHGIEGLEFQLDWIDSYQAGLQHLTRNHYDACLIDYSLGGEFNGLDLLQEACKQDCNVPFILLTSYNDRTLDITAMQAGAVDFLSKEDINSALLERSIRYAIANKRSQMELRQSHNELETRIAERTAELKITNLTLEEKIGEMEALKQEIQASLEWRTRQVETSTQIAQEIAAAPALDVLFRSVVNLVQRRFGYYHAHLYTLEGENLVMQEGTGDAGRMMKRVGHKIPFRAARSLVARSARSGDAILVPDVTVDKRWLPNLLLAETKTELAVPIKLGNEVMGVLDIQNDKVNGLSVEDQLLMIGLCGQIAVAINNQRLQAEREKAEEARTKLIEELNSFGHTVGHNLKDPVGLIIGYSALLKEQVRLPEELDTYLNAIIRNAHKLNNIIEELQLLSGVRQEKMEVHPVNMLRVVAEVQQRLAYMIKEYDAKIIVSEYWPVALGHTPWIEEVWANYISNAIKYGGRPPKIYLGATEQSDGMIRFWVRDNGDGLSPAEQAQVFQEFSRLNQARLKGYGLGLSIVKRIITKLDGNVSVSSEGIPGNGCVFTFTLPGLKYKKPV